MMERDSVKIPQFKIVRNKSTEEEEEEKNNDNPSTRRKRNRLNTITHGNFKSNNFKLNFKMYNHSEDHFQTICDLVSIENRSVIQSNSIRDYIISITNFNVLHGLYKDELSYHIHIHNLSQAINYQFNPVNHILFKYGDRGERYYIILKGSVDILIPKWVELQISKKEYLVYLAKFRLYKENQILSEVLDKNKEKINISISEIDQFIEYEIKEYNKKNRGKNKKKDPASTIKHFKSIREAGFKRRTSLNVNDMINRSNKLLHSLMEDNQIIFSQKENNSKNKDVFIEPEKDYLNSLKHDDIFEQKNIFNFQDNLFQKSNLVDELTNKYHIKNKGFMNDLGYMQNDEKNLLRKSKTKNLQTIIEDDQQENDFKIDNRAENGESYKFFDSESLERKNSLFKKNKESLHSSLINKFQDSSNLIKNDSESKNQSSNNRKNDVNDIYFKEVDPTDSFNIANNKNKCLSNNNVFNSLKSNNFLSHYQKVSNESINPSDINMYSISNPRKMKRSFTLVPGVMNSLKKFQQGAGNISKKSSKYDGAYKLNTKKKNTNSQSHGSNEETSQISEISDDDKSLKSHKDEDLDTRQSKYGLYNESELDKQINFFDDFYFKYIQNIWNMNNTDSESYINRLIVIKNINNNENKENEMNLIGISMINYYNVKKLTTGEIFGEVALKEENKKRTATIITSHPTHFGWSDKDYYDHILSDRKTKSIQNEVVNLLNCPIFKNHNKITFYREIYFQLKKQYVIRSELIFKEGDELNYITFLNEGEYVLRVKKSFIEINELIKKLGGTPYNEVMELEEIGENDEFRKFMECKNEIKVYYINKTDVIGIDDYTLNNKFLFDLECISPKGKIFLMDKENFKMHEESNKNLREYVAKYQKEKRKNIINRLNDIKKSKISIFKRDKKDYSQTLDKLFKFSNESYFSHKDINQIEKETLALEKKKLIKNRLNSFKKLSNTKIIKIKTKENDQSDYNDRIIQNQNSKPDKTITNANSIKKIQSSIRLHKIINEKFSAKNEEIDRMTAHKLKLSYFENKNPSDHAYKIIEKNAKHNDTSDSPRKTTLFELKELSLQGMKGDLNYEKEIYKTNFLTKESDRNIYPKTYLNLHENILAKNKTKKNTSSNNSILKNEFMKIKQFYKDKQYQKINEEPRIKIHNDEQLLSSYENTSKYKRQISRNYISNNLDSDAFEEYLKIESFKLDEKFASLKKVKGSERHLNQCLSNSNLKFPRIFQSPIKNNKYNLMNQGESFKNQNKIRMVSNINKNYNNIEISIIRFSQINGDKIN